MKKIIRRVVDRTERLLYGATAEEAVARQIALIDRRVDAAIARMFERLEQDEDEATPSTDDDAER